MAEELRGALPKEVAVEAVTGMLPPADREARVDALAASTRKRVLVATDCLSARASTSRSHFDAVVHYDLAWNPTRHEQREGRVDRYGQRQPDRPGASRYYGTDNPIDGIVLDVLLRKHKKIRGSLGISVPVPVDTETVLRPSSRAPPARARDEQLDPRLMGGEVTSRAVHEPNGRRRRRGRSARGRCSPSTPSAPRGRRRAASRPAAIGSSVDVRRFVERRARASGGAVLSGEDPLDDRARGDPAGAARRARAIERREGLRVRFELPVTEGVLHSTARIPWSPA